MYFVFLVLFCLPTWNPFMWSGNFKFFYTFSSFCHRLQCSPGWPTFTMCLRMTFNSWDYRHVLPYSTVLAEPLNLEWNLEWWPLSFLKVDFCQWLLSEILRGYSFEGFSEPLHNLVWGHAWQARKCGVTENCLGDGSFMTVLELSM